MPGNFVPAAESTLSDLRHHAQLGASYQQAADALGLTYSQVRHLALDYGIKFRRAAAPVVTQKEISAVQALAAAGVSRRHAARRLRVKVSRISWLVKKYGVQFVVAKFGRPQRLRANAKPPTHYDPFACACGSRFFGLPNGSQRCSLCLATAAQQMRRAA